MGMLKRKRSESELSFSSGSTFSSPPRPGGSNFSFASDAGMSSPVRCLLPGRTMKRFRDNRLPEEEIHQNTLKMLYSAQQQQQQQQQHHGRLDQPQHHEEASHESPQLALLSSRSSGQRSLHAFWNIPSPSPAAARPDVLPPPIERAALALADDQTSCEDCGARMACGGDDGGALMDVDAYADAAAGAARCVVCGKVVCGGCSVSNLGVEPRCLVCAGRGGRWSQQRGLSAW